MEVILYMTGLARQGFIRKFCFLMLFLAILVIHTATLNAGINVSTKEIVTEVQPGTNKQVTFTVTNDGDTAQEVRVLIKDWELNENGERIILEPGEEPHSLAEFINYSPQNFELSPEKSKTVQIDITIPKEVKGPHWSMFIVAGRPVKTVEGGNVTVKISAGYPLNLIQIDPAKATKKGSIEEFDVFKTEQGQLTAQISFKNSGSLPLTPSGRIEIRDNRGTVVENKEVSTFEVLPSGTRLLEVPLTKDLNSGNYLLVSIIDFGGDFKVAKQKKFTVD